MIKLYGTGRGNGSWARVTAGVKWGLESCGKLAGFFDVSRVDADYDTDGHALSDGYDAPVGLCIGSPSSASVMVGRGEHARRLLMIAANSSWLPATTMERAAKICTGFVAPSEWSASVIDGYAEGRPVLVYPHGVDPAFMPTADRPSGYFRALHLASTHMERKGTKELIHGWALAIRKQMLPKGAVLRLIIDGPRGLFNHTIFEAAAGDPDVADSYQLSQRLDLKAEDMAALYRDHHVVVQPSRAEGFGMVPLEARACGVPVVMTACTGHEDHWRGPGVVRVAAGPEAAVDDGPGAMAPTVRAEDIAEAVGYALSSANSLREEATDAAPKVRERWSWEAVTERFLVENQAILGA
jgi:glycosyltransferase involved in cell wall biosynthesis